MKKAFTLIELIFVIVIIGLLAAVAVPKFVNLKQHAEAANVVKATIDTASAAVSVAVNLRDLEGNNSFELKDLVKLDGKGWSYVNDQNGSYEYNDSVNNQRVAKITLYSTNNSDANNTVEYSIDCTKFSDTKTQEKCEQLLGSPSVDVNLTY